MGLSFRQHAGIQATRLGIAVGGALLAGLYGVLHDQITFTLSPEYFTNLKFHQFQWANWGLGDRVFVAVIGFLATWWVGFIVAWILAFRLVRTVPGPSDFLQVRRAIAVVFGCAIATGLAGYLLGLWKNSCSDFSDWDGIRLSLQVMDVPSFVRVAFIHNAGYLGGAIGLVIALIVVHPSAANEAASEERA